MRWRQMGASLIPLGLVAAGCGGGAPSAPSSLTPSTPTGLGAAATQSIVAATLSQATNVAISISPSGDLSRVTTFTCPGGGSMTLTFSANVPAGPSGMFTSSSRTDFSDCRSQSVTINGDPYLLMTGEHVFGPTADGVPSTMTATIRTTGGLRFDANGTQGRAQYNCTQVMSLQIGSNGTPAQPSITSTGTITWEQPLGTVTVRPCGP